MLGLFYRPDENAVLFNLYRTMCAETNAAMTHNSPAYFTYNDLCRKVNGSKGGKFSGHHSKRANERLVAQDAAHYCKKLEKCGFLVCECFTTSSEKKISMRKQDIKMGKKRRTNVTSD